MRQRVLSVLTTAERPASVLIEDAIRETRNLIQLEVELAKDELRCELSTIRSFAIVAGIAAGLTVSGLTLLLVALSLAFGATYVPALILGGITLVVAAVVEAVAYKKLPRRALTETARRVGIDIKLVRQHLS